jgi:hypothetical protein
MNGCTTRVGKCRVHAFVQARDTRLKDDSHIPCRSPAALKANSHITCRSHAVTLPLPCNSPTVPNAGTSPTCRLRTADANSHIQCRSPVANPWPWEVAFRTAYSWHGRGTAWHVWIRLKSAETAILQIRIWRKLKPSRLNKKQHKLRICVKKTPKDWVSFNEDGWMHSVGLAHKKPDHTEYEWQVS